MPQPSSVTPHEKHQSREFLLALGLRTAPQVERWLKRNPFSVEAEKVRQAKARAYTKPSRNEES